MCKPKAAVPVGGLLAAVVAVAVAVWVLWQVAVALAAGAVVCGALMAAAAWGTRRLARSRLVLGRRAYRLVNGAPVWAEVQLRALNPPRAAIAAPKAWPGTVPGRERNEVTGWTARR